MEAAPARAGPHRPANRSGTISDPRINERIRVPEVRLVGPNGEQVGIVRIEDALRLAGEADLDLVEVAPTAKPPVCKLMDFGKFKYEAAVKARESRKKQVNTVLKEVRFRLKIDSHDYETKTGHAMKFLSQGDKVKAIIQFRGREQQRPELGIRLLEKFAADVAELGTVESQPRQDGRNMVMVIGPVRTKADAREDQVKDTAPQRERKGGGSRRDQAAREAKAAAAAKAEANAAPVKNSVGDAFPEQLRSFAAERAEEAERRATAPAESKRAPEAPQQAASVEKKAAPVPRQAAPKIPAAPTAPAPQAPAAEPTAAPTSAPKPAAAPKPTPVPKPMPAPPKPATPRKGAPKPGQRG
ncbi:translation initiation factor IF-3 [Micrococcus lacusdianchii]|uniref:translation initiation factor IF-3 n=1 Tax=Micrococcus lacusdianchii TaxID=2915940 RepID=UPI002003247C|nr:translation initiation factor IF-3 [Micrococcus sp. JXJ CY 30]